MATAKLAPSLAEQSQQVNPQQLVPKHSHQPRDPVEAFPWLPCDVTVEIPVPAFTVGDLLKVKRGVVVQTETPVTNHVSVLVNGLLIASAEFEVRNDQLAVRITEFM